MVQIWGSGTNLSPPLAHFKLSELGTHQNLRIMGELKGFPTPPVTYLGRMAAVRALRRDLGMLDKYKLVPYEEDLPSLADTTPFGFEAMQLQLDPEATNVLLEGFEDQSTAEEKLRMKVWMMSRWEMVLPWLQHLMDLPMQASPTELHEFWPAATVQQQLTGATGGFGSLDQVRTPLMSKSAHLQAGPTTQQAGSMTAGWQQPMTSDERQWPSSISSLPPTTRLHVTGSREQIKRIFCKPNSLQGQAVSGADMAGAQPSVQVHSLKTLGDLCNLDRPLVYKASAVTDAPKSLAAAVGAAEPSTDIESDDDDPHRQAGDAGPSCRMPAIPAQRTDPHVTALSQQLPGCTGGNSSTYQQQRPANTSGLDGRLSQSLVPSTCSMFKGFAATSSAEAQENRPGLFRSGTLPLQRGVLGDVTVHSRVHTSSSQAFGAGDLHYGATGDRVGRATYDYDGVDELALDQPDEPYGFEPRSVASLLAGGQTAY
ncbi:TPA: hypothetical protein ACH3X1_001189 [Trebouxia sp. C0004]